jgi:hypothetical protein
MQKTKVFETCQRIDAWLRAIFSQPAVAFSALLTVILMAHGYEIFNLHLTIDEELHIGNHDIAMAWVGQGRWGMGLLSALLPSSVVPAVSIALGVGLLATSLWLITVRNLDADRYAGFCAVSIAMTLPMLPFTMSFATLAYGIGFASLATVGFTMWQRSERPAGLFGAVVAGAFAISVYQPMVFALAALVVPGIFRKDVALYDRARLRGVFVLLVAVAVYFAVDQAVRRLLGADLQYVDQFVDLRGLLAHPLDRLSVSAHEVLAVFRSSRRLFTLQTPWFITFLLGACLVAAMPTSTQGPRQYTAPLVIAGLIALPIVAGALTAHGIPLRSGVYFPFVVCMIAAISFRNAGAAARLGLSALALLAVLGNSVICNRLYASASFAYERDRLIANDIMREVAKLNSLETAPRQLQIEVVGIKSWPESALIPKRETLGASFFEWESGNRYRIASFLSMLGLDVRGASDQERLPFIPVALQMPSWPLEGWVRREQDVIIVKLGEYTPFQRQALCTAGVRNLCP